MNNAPDSMMSDPGAGTTEISPLPGMILLGSSLVALPMLSTTKNSNVLSVTSVTDRGVKSVVRHSPAKIQIGFDGSPMKNGGA